MFQVNELNREAMTIRLEGPLPDYPAFAEGIRRAPDRGWTLNRAETELAVKNALPVRAGGVPRSPSPRVPGGTPHPGTDLRLPFPPRGPDPGAFGQSVPGKCLAGKAFQVMIDNNLDFDIALYPYELVTYGETGQVCQNWLQYRLIKKYLEELTEDTTLVLESGHPLGLFRSRPDAPRVILTNGMLVGLFDNQDEWHRGMQLGVTNYGQMTAGGWMYIGPQGIVHGTFNTILNAARQRLGVGQKENLAGILFVSSGLGGMAAPSRRRWRSPEGGDRRRGGFLPDRDPAQPGMGQPGGGDLRGGLLHGRRSLQGEKAVVHRLPRQHRGPAPVRRRPRDRDPPAVGPDILPRTLRRRLLPPGLTFDERTALLSKDPAEYRRLVDISLRKHYELIKVLSDRGTFFFDYGNSFLRAVFDAGVTEVCKNGENTYDGFIWPSYVEDIMGPVLFDYGYGPFRWVCLSGDPEDLRKTDRAAMECIDPDRRAQDYDNWAWIRDAEKNALVVGTQARILYQDAEGRTRIALKFNEMVRKGEIGPVMLGRDHHDVSGTDSPYRETANIKDGSNICADMATVCFAGNAARGMTLCALHNGGGVGIGKAVNGGFGLLLDGRESTDEIIRSAMMWDVLGGVARRAWAQNPNAMEVSREVNRTYPGDTTSPSPTRSETTP